ncbi:MAG: hypothetical protein IPL39_21070 [Opitutaceae bacterium]|nr:hypothetical protein [Opitutaceae bacterium]
MSPADAYPIISAAMARMSALYGCTLFNEWVVVRLGPNTATVEHYEGPRLAECLALFAQDVAPLRREASDRAHEPGDFDFARGTAGTQFDALLKIATDAYLLCNNTDLSMEQIRANPAWLKAQVPFANLSERFRLHPMQFGAA